MYRTAASCFCVLMISILVQTPWQGLLDIPNPSADEIAIAVSFGVLANINVSSLQTAEDMEWVCDLVTEAEGQPLRALLNVRVLPHQADVNIEKLGFASNPVGAAGARRPFLACHRVCRGRSARAPA